MKIRTLSAVWHAGFAESWVKRRAFFFDLTLMVLNDVVWVIFWRLFFRGSLQVKGWNVDRIMLLFSVTTAVFGLTLGLLANVRWLGKMAVEGELDAALSLPVDPLTYLMVRKVSPVLLGDLAFGVGLFLVAGHPTPVRVLVYVCAVLLGAVALTSFLVILGASVLLLGGGGSGGGVDQTSVGLDTILMLTFYPMDVFGGPAKLIMFSVIPAAFVTAFPARMLYSFSAVEAAILVFVCLGMAVSARLLFSAGMRHYRSGSHWTLG